ncbi:hypothetical protein LZ554_001258 [Drepanopeziza brunnea f. sp. 'monogermtubi']|nr:hypothetical protein LZ554_001258 [Drepanopeziza brunnea f. sp. 'monogermtubi']
MMTSASCIQPDLYLPVKREVRSTLVQDTAYWLTLGIHSNVSQSAFEHAATTLVPVGLINQVGRPSIHPSYRDS